MTIIVSIISVIFFFATVLLLQKHMKVRRRLELEQKEKEDLKSNAEIQKAKAKEIAQQYYVAVGYYKRLKTEYEKIKSENELLGKWRPIIDAEAKAKEILASAEQEKQILINQINAKVAETQNRIKRALSAAEQKRRAILQTAESQSKNIIVDAENRASSITFNGLQKSKEIQERIALLESQAQYILSDAEKKSDKIYEDAYGKLALYQSEYSKLESTAKAIENKIKGYGTEYLVPGIGLLDEIAEDYSHKEAGQSLKTARQKVRTLFKSGLAAECDYVENVRRTTAIAFVADAFNGKVEDILSRVKHDNYGKLSQEIRDSALIVNQNGKAFRDARIRPEYITARLEELRCATVVHELRVKEREEQRALREKMREEEKVRKEIERAKKEAEKEEMVAKKVLDEALKRFEAMSAEQRQSHAKELEELQERVRLAEERKRTISMAEQTKVGHVYIISNIGSFGENVFKIGMTRRLDPLDRVYELGSASVPFPFDIHAMIHTENAPEFETRLHRFLVMNQLNKTNSRKEFFRIDLSKIKSLVEGLGVEAHWTEYFEAAQYRESLLIEERIASDTEYRKQWEERQFRLEMLEMNENDDESEA